MRNCLKSTALITPSFSRVLHDAGGTVVLEAWAYGLPVICLSLGGPGRIVASTCGRVVPVAGRSEDDCIDMLASAIAALAEDENYRRELSRGAIARSREFSWSKVVTSLYAEIGRKLQHRDSTSTARQQILGRDGCGYGRARRRRPLKQASGAPCHCKGRLVALSKHRLDRSSLQILANAFIESLAINNVRFKHRFRGELDIHIAVGKANHKRRHDHPALEGLLEDERAEGLGRVLLAVAGGVHEIAGPSQDLGSSRRRPVRGPPLRCRT